MNELTFASTPWQSFVDTWLFCIIDMAKRGITRPKSMDCTFIDLFPLADTFDEHRNLSNAKFDLKAQKVYCDPKVQYVVFENYNTCFSTIKRLSVVLRLRYGQTRKAGMMRKTWWDEDLPNLSHDLPRKYLEFSQSFFALFCFGFCIFHINHTVNKILRPFVSLYSRQNLYSIKRIAFESCDSKNVLISNSFSCAHVCLFVC